MTELIPISKAGNPQLNIHPDALEQHLHLGWVVVEKEVDQMAEKVKPGRKSKSTEAE